MGLWLDIKKAITNTHQRQIGSASVLMMHHFLHYIYINIMRQKDCILNGRKGQIGLPQEKHEWRRSMLSYGRKC
jgi:hypothetical protein